MSVSMRAERGLCAAGRGCGAVMVAVAGCLLIATASGAAAESLRDALTAAYRANPQLDAERARLRATDEDVARAQSGYRPTVTGEASYGHATSTSKPRIDDDGGSRPGSLGVSVRQPLFDGFRTTNAVNEAEANVRAGRSTLRQVETTVLLEAVTAYVTVLRETSLLKLREQNVGVLSRELEAAEARRAAREVTLTDVAQARSRRARAVSEADLAKANLKIARADYQRVVGHQPQVLRQPSTRVMGLPASLDEALAIAAQDSPAIIAALFREQAARFGVDRNWGELLPEVNVEATYAHQTHSSPIVDSRDSASISGRVTVPFYRGGEVHARVRQAKHTHVSRLQEVEQARAEAESRVTAAWSRLLAARAQMESDDVQVRSAKIALEGVREEERVGQRTLLDVLNAEQEALDAQVALVSTRRDLVVATYTVLAEIGRLEVEAIALDTEVYEPEAHYDEVRRKWAGITITLSTLPSDGSPEAPPQGYAEPMRLGGDEPTVAPARSRSAAPRRAAAAEQERVAERSAGFSFKRTLAADPHPGPRAGVAGQTHPVGQAPDLFKKTMR
ncbi:MAG: TolC family outer membrane protein [Hyphomicrobiaceae bacterium]|nr:TolC family outer membrane protein [Hyphomicrobiaceae bacterium]